MFAVEQNKTSYEYKKPHDSAHALKKKLKMIMAKKKQSPFTAAAATKQARHIVLKLIKPIKSHSQLTFI